MNSEWERLCRYFQSGNGWTSAVIEHQYSTMIRMKDE